VPGLLEATRIRLALPVLLFGILPVTEQIAQQRRGLVKAPGGILGGAVRGQQLGVRLARLGHRLGVRGDFRGSGTQQRLGVLDTGGLKVGGQFGVCRAVLGGQPLGLAA
jgi:hypothetical protein